jgi:hypothetical protein
LRGTVGETPGTLVFYSDASGNIGIGKYAPGTLLDVNGVITATSGTSTEWNTAYTHSQIAGGDSVHVSVTENSNWDAAYTHITNNGTDHSYINQSVKTTDSPSFIGASFLDAELTQPVTTYGTATTYGKIEPDSASDGGLRIWGFSDAVGQRAIVQIGIIGVTDPTDTTPCVVLAGGKSDGGTSATSLGPDETVFQIENWGTARFKVMGDGALYVGGSETGVTGTELEELTDGSETTLHSHAGGGGGDTFTDRGDPSAADFTQATLTLDATWRDLDLSSIVPEGTKFVHLTGNITHTAAGTFLLLRKNGNTNTVNSKGVVVQVANINQYWDKIVACDASRVVEYYGSASFTSLGITVGSYIV